MIKRFQARGINGAISCDFNFHDDINIITGKNGAGKTTILKVIWYLMSANIERIPREMSFEGLSLETDQYAISIEKAPDEGRRTDLYSITFTRPDRSLREAKQELKVTRTDIAQEESRVRAINQAIGNIGKSIFFPTFRRVEGGFSMTPDGSRRFDRRTPVAYEEGPDVILRGFSALAQRLSTFEHIFVTSISTDDIVRLLTAKYAAISETTNRSHKELSDKIFALIHDYEATRFDEEKVQFQRAKDSLGEIAARVGDFTRFSDALLRPFTTLSSLVTKIFENKAIEVSENIVLGGQGTLINSALLSSGEKHMLSFLAYNAFNDKTPIFIDEPEISLHVDWQRMLFPLLLDQGTSNQFIVATHSPFIYTKFSDKELALAADRGGN